MNKKILGCLNKEISIVPIALVVISILSIIIIISLKGGTIPKSPDAVRKSGIRQINLAMDMYYDDYGEYLQSEKIPIAIGNYLNPVPIENPMRGPCYSYQWISNMIDPQKYCVWACLGDGKFFVANQKGVKTLEKAPTDLNCGEEETTADETVNWKTYTNEEFGFEIKYPDIKDVLLIAQADSAREFLFSAVPCGYSEEESNVLGLIKFFPAIEGGFANSEYGKKYTEAECDNLVTRYIMHGRFCTDRNLTKYQDWCKEGSEISDYHRYDIYLACDWRGKEGRVKCNNLFNQMLSTFKFID